MKKHKGVNLEFKKTYAVVVDGETEGFYLQMLIKHERNNNKSIVKIDPKIPQRKRLKDQYDKVKELAENYTLVYWIVDLDTIIKETREARKGDKKPMTEFIEYRKYIEEKIDNVIILVNNPCLEYWFLLHFENIYKRFNNCASAERDLKKYLHDYNKNKKYFTKQNNDIYKRLMPYQETAIKNARATGKFSNSNPKDTICEMPQLILKLKALLN